MLIWYEFQKVWRRGSFLGLMLLILILNLFLLWYFNRPAEEEAALSAYKTVCREISGMTEEEKLAEAKRQEKLEKKRASNRKYMARKREEARKAWAEIEAEKAKAVGQ